MPEPPPRPTDAELAVLRVLWDRGGRSTVREVLGELEKTRPVGYTTVLKFLQIMTEKRLVAREKRRNTHVYWALVSEESTQRHLVRDLLERAFPGSPSRLVMQALTEKRASAEELAEIRRLLDELEREER